MTTVQLLYHQNGDILYLNCDSVYQARGFGEAMLNDGTANPDAIVLNDGAQAIGVVSGDDFTGKSLQQIRYWLGKAKPGPTVRQNPAPQ